MTEVDTTGQIAAGILAETENIILASLDDCGYPRPVPMNRLRSEGLSTVWLTTEYDGEKGRNFRADSRAGLCFYSPRGSVVLRGEVEVLRDEATRKEFWQEDFLPYFPGGAEDPQYCILRFVASHAKCWLDGKMSEFDL